MKGINQNFTNVIRFTDDLVFLRQRFIDSDDFFHTVNEKLLAANLVTIDFLQNIRLRERISYRIGVGIVFNCYSSYRY